MMNSLTIWINSDCLGGRFMALPSKVVSLWFWPQLEQASVPSSIQCMDNSLVSNNFLALLSASNRMLHALVFYKKKVCS